MPIKRNKNIVLDSAISALIQTYGEYKKAVIKNLQLTWIDSNGNFACADGFEERCKEIERLTEEINGLAIRVKELRGVMENE